MKANKKHFATIHSILCVGLFTLTLVCLPNLLNAQTNNVNSVNTWGANNWGQLGDGTTVDKSSPVETVPPISDAVSVKNGSTHSLALKKNGTVWAWGRNNYGQLGNGTTNNATSPIQVSGLTNVVQIAIGITHSLALDSTYKVYAWGNNNQGQLGDGTTIKKLVPTLVLAPAGSTNSVYLNNVIRIAAGNSHNLAAVGVVSGGGVASFSGVQAIYAWGFNNNGQLGDGTTINRSIPTKATNNGGVIVGGEMVSLSGDIAAGGYHSLSLNKDGTLNAWGLNGNGQLGDGTTINRLIPTRVINESGVPATTLGGVTTISAGGSHSLVAKSNSTVRAWGANTYGQLGDGTTVNKNFPITVASPNGAPTGMLAAAVAAGGSHSLAVSNGGVYAWGYNAYGQLGDGTTSNRSIPTVIPGLNVAASSNGVAINSGGGVSPNGIVVSLTGTTISGGLFHSSAINQ